MRMEVGLIADTSNKQFLEAITCFEEVAFVEEGYASAGIEDRRSVPIERT